MLLEMFPDELVHRIIKELHFSSVDDKEFYVPRRRQERQETGVHWTNDHLIPISVINNQFRRVCLPVLYESVDIIAQDYQEKSIRQYHTDVRRFIRLLSLRSHVSFAIKQVNIRTSISSSGLYPTNFTHNSLLAILGKLPNLQVLSGMDSPSELDTEAINNCSLSYIETSEYSTQEISISRIAREPNVLRKFRIQRYIIDNANEHEWLYTATPVHVNHFEIWDFPAAIEVFDKAPTVSCLKSIGILISDEDEDTAPDFMERLQTYIHGPGQGVTHISFDIDISRQDFHEMQYFPGAGLVLDALSSVEGGLNDEDDPLRLYKYDIRLVSHQSVSHIGWDGWVILSLKLSSCPLDESFLKAISEQAPFLETLDIRVVDTSNRCKEWSDYFLENNGFAKIFKPFRFMKALHLPTIRASPADISDKLNCDHKFESSLEHSTHSFNELAFSLLETLCKELGKEMHFLERVGLLIQHDKDNNHFDLTANLRRRISTEGPWIEVDVYRTRH